MPTKVSVTKALNSVIAKAVDSGKPGLGLAIVCLQNHLQHLNSAFARSFLKQKHDQRPPKIDVFFIGQILAPFLDLQIYKCDFSL